MGSGATKINSNECHKSIDICTSKSKLSSENIDSFAGKNKNTLSAETVAVGSEFGHGLKTQTPKQDINHDSLDQKTKNEPDVQIKKLKNISSNSKTDVISLKPIIPEPDEKEKEKSSEMIKRLNKELATSESQRLDLQEQIQLLQEKLLSLEKQEHLPSIDPNSLQETLNAKDQYILKLERDAKTNQVDANKLRIKLKKRIKALANQLHETRQGASISQMELKAEISRQAEQIKSLKGQSDCSSFEQEVGRPHQDQEHSKIIVELSNQLSEQVDQISSLETELAEKKKEISDLKLAISDHYDTKDTMLTQSVNSSNSLLPHTSTDRLHSSRGKRISRPHDRSHESETHDHNENFDISQTPYHVSDTKYSPELIKRQSTTLSDSDSDWGDNPTPSHTHSAPARSRVKSAISLASSGKHKGSLVTLNGNDDSIMDMVSASPTDPSFDLKDSRKKSTLKNHLEKTRNENQFKSLIGPSLAFERKADPFSDTSCEPTPRTLNTNLHTNPKVRIVKPIVH